MNDDNKVIVHEDTELQKIEDCFSGEVQNKLTNYGEILECELEAVKRFVEAGMSRNTLDKVDKIIHKFCYLDD